MFDPQLYLTGIDAHRAPGDCVNLASYDWFGVPASPYDSGMMKQHQWKKQQLTTIGGRWKGHPPLNHAIRPSVEACLRFQAQLGFAPLIAPSPLTVDLSSDLSTEMQWLDTAIDVRRELLPDEPLYATVALSDVCLAYMEPSHNPLIESLLDVVSAREVQGVYLIVEQASEAGDGRHCATSRTLQAILHMVHIWSRDSGLQVMLNFLGPASLVCRAAGAAGWATNWYKSNVRLRIADMYSDGRAFPSYWSMPAAADIHLHEEMDMLVQRGELPRIEDITSASDRMLQALRRGRKIAGIPEWAYTQSNVAACSEHYIRSCAAADRELESVDQQDRIGWITRWLENASSISPAITSLQPDPKKRKTKTNHIGAWLKALQDHARIHGV